MTVNCGSSQDLAQLRPGHRPLPAPGGAFFVPLGATAADHRAEPSGQPIDYERAGVFLPGLRLRVEDRAHSAMTTFPAA